MIYSKIYAIKKEEDRTTMINYRKGKERFKPNELGSLYIDKEKLDTTSRPVIYIGGQMEHRCHILEQTGFTADSGHNMFTGNWFYDYPIVGNNKSAINAQNMTANLLESLKMANLSEVDLVTESFGGLIGAYASKDKRIHKVYAIHPPITGTPLADPEKLKKYSEYFSKEEKLIRLLLTRLINTKYGFERDNYHGADLRAVDLNKLLVIGSSLDLEREQNALTKTLYDMILLSSGRLSDGVVIFDEELFNQLGIDHVKELHGLNHFDAGSDENLQGVKKYIEAAESSDKYDYTLEYALRTWLLADLIEDAKLKRKIEIRLTLLLHFASESYQKRALIEAIEKHDDKTIGYYVRLIVRTLENKSLYQKSTQEKVQNLRPKRSN